MVQMIQSWAAKDSEVTSIEEILGWIEKKNRETQVEIQKNYLEDSSDWFYDKKEGCIRNQKRSFFTITGLRQTKDGGHTVTQPIIVQDEIGI